MKKLLINVSEQDTAPVQTWPSLKKETESILEKLKIKRLAINDEIRNIPSGQSEIRTSYNTYRNALNKLISDSERLIKSIPTLMELYKDHEEWEEEKSFIELRRELRRIYDEYFNPTVSLPIKGEKRYETIS